MDSVDVVLLTLNSERKLEDCLTSVYKNVPVAQLIVIDGGSSDRTLDILRKFDEKYHNVKVVPDRGTRATARQKGIQNVTTAWFLFVDSDVVLCNNWFKKAAKYLDSDVGAVWGIEVWSTIQNQAMLKMFLWVTRKIFDLRGGTHDTLIRTEAVKNIHIPASLHVFEDAYLMDWVRSQGYRVLACYNPFCIHYRPKTVWTLQGSLNLIIESLRFGSCKLLAKLGLAYGFYTAYAIYQILDSNKSKP
ncbi:MAG: glycosyltransferase family 2 protein [Candidatus Bathyarchaeota archaeon]|nr:glycosyltransferase family 2 protein [Candidatus Bathyarchaeota archaeon]